MENNSKMYQLCVRKVTQDVTMFVWLKQEVISKKTSSLSSFVPEIFTEVVKNLRYSVWIESYCNEFVWEDFLRNHFKRMTTTPYLFSNYVAYACYLLHKSTACPFESFFYTLSLVTHIVLFCWQRQRKEFIYTCVDLFCTFFEKEICSDFEDQGGWQSLNNYLDNQYFLIRCKELISAEQPVYELFKECQNKLLESEEPFDIDGVVLKDITGTQVETNQEAIDFAKSVAGKIKDLCNLTFEEILTDFEKTDRQVEELYREIVGEASGGVSSEEDEASSEEVREEVLEGIPSKPKSEENKDQGKVETPDTLETQDLEALKSQDFGPESQGLGMIGKLTKAERAKKLLEVMLEDISRMHELIKFVCDENVPEARIQLVDTNSNS